MCMCSSSNPFFYPCNTNILTATRYISCADVQCGSKCTWSIIMSPRLVPIDFRSSICPILSRYSWMKVVAAWVWVVGMTPGLLISAGYFILLITSVLPTADNGIHPFFFGKVSLCLLYFCQWWRPWCYFCRYWLDNVFSIPCFHLYLHAWQHCLRGIKIAVLLFEIWHYVRFHHLVSEFLDYVVL